jgi:hypothetical protein
MHHLQENKITTHSINSQSWESQQVELYAQIQGFAIDYPGASLPFSQRLARDHQWSLTYAQRVIEEYKKFLFLAIVADHPVTPSNAVDQAWHLHLTYTHSYWNDLCTQVLPRPLHHCPTQGGQQQGELFWDCYSKTLDSYERFFGYGVPVDIWPDPATRFRQAGQFWQVNSEDYWVIPKPSFAQSQRVFWKISHLPWLRNCMIALLAIGLVNLINLDLIVNQIIQPVFAQVPSILNSNLPIDSGIKPTQNFEWIWWGIGVLIAIGLIALYIFVQVRMDSQCPACKRFWAVKTTTQVLLKPTEQTDGESLAVTRCGCCEYTQQKRYETRFQPPEPSGCMGCACMG